MFYLTSKFHGNRVNTFGFMEGGGRAFETPPQAQDRIGLLCYKKYSGTT